MKQYKFEISKRERNLDVLTELLDDLKLNLRLEVDF